MQADPDHRTAEVRTEDDEDQVFLRAMGSLTSVPNKDLSGTLDKGERSTPPSGRRGRRRRQINIEGRLDLHGHSAEEALKSLETFVTTSLGHGRRNLLVITGRGRGSPRGESVLKRVVRGWFRRRGGPLGAELRPAPAQLGGDGAFLIELGRKAR